MLNSVKLMWWKSSKVQLSKLPHPELGNIVLGSLAVRDQLKLGLPGIFGKNK